MTLFFVLSGFLITGILWDNFHKPGWWRTFFLRRSLRIFPLYYFALLLVVISLLILHAGRSSFTHLLVFVFYGQNIPGLDNANDAVRSPLRIYHFWSLAAEEQFYLLWPLLLSRMKNLKNARQLCIAVFLLSFASRIAFVALHAGSGHNSTIARAGELVLGAWIALTLRQSPGVLDRWRRAAPVILTGSAVVVIGCVIAAASVDMLSAPMYIFGLPAFSLFFGTLLVLALQPGHTSRLFSFRPLRHLGNISYGVYVYHVLFITFFGAITQRLVPHASHNLAAGVELIVGAVCTLIAAELSFYLLEQPFLRLKDRWAPNPAKAR